MIRLHNKSISHSINKLHSSVLSNQFIAQEILSILKLIYPQCAINIYLIDIKSKKIETTLSNSDLWPIPHYKIKWLTRQKKEHYLLKETPSSYIYIPDRPSSILTDFRQFALDQEKYQFSCKDGLFFKIDNDAPTTFGIIFIHGWYTKRTLTELFPDLADRNSLTNTYLSKAVHAIENFYIHKKIEALVSDKNKLTVKLQKDKEDLKRRVLELTTLYDASNELSHLLNYSEIIKKIVFALNQVLHFDCCCIYLNSLFQKSTLYLTITSEASSTLIDELFSSILDSIQPFFSNTIIKEETAHFIEMLRKKKTVIHSVEDLQSHANIPLIFREEIIGVITINTLNKNAFSSEEIQFLHTLSNLLASTLGRLKIMRDLEESKISSVIQSMTEPILLTDENHSLQSFNSEAGTLFSLTPNKKLPKEYLFTLLNNLGLLKLYNKVFESHQAISNQHIHYNNRFFSVTISPLVNNEIGYVGILLTFRDITNIKEMDRIKSQRLNAISKVNSIINSIQNLNELLQILKEFFLNLTASDMGSIQLEENDEFVTVVHSNFPEKIRRHYRFNTDKTISDVALEKKELLLINNYFENPELNPNVKVLIACYLCIPIIINNNVIGIINLARKFGSSAKSFTDEDIDTIRTVSSLTGTAIQNAIFYENQLKKEKLDQELKVATKIQANLLPKTVPIQNKLQLGLLSIPAREIGGDYYDFIPLESNKIGLIIADIIGKGIPAGLYMAMLKSILTRHILPTYSTEKALSNLNNIIFHDPVITKYIPLFYGIFDLDKQTFTYTNAGHEPPFILRKNDFIKLDTDGFPLGGVQNEIFTEKTISIEDNDLFCFFTDGIVDIRNPKNTGLGVHGLQDFIQTHKEYPSQVILNKLHQFIKSYSSNSSNIDDITVITAKFDKNSTYNDLDKALFQKEIRTTSEIKQIKRIRNEVKEICVQAGFNHKNSLDIQLAINEAQANIIEHAYLGDETKHITFQFTIYSNKLSIIIKDFGHRIKKENLQKNQLSLDNLEGSGLGLYLINTLMDEVYYKHNEIGTELHLIKYKINTSET